MRHIILDNARRKDRKGTLPVPRSASRPHPPQGLRVTIRLAQTIRDANAGRPMNRVLLAEAMGLSPGSSGFRDLIMSSGRYGLTNGNYRSDMISLTALGESLTAPRDAGERTTATRSSIAQVPVYGQLLDHFANARLPESAFLKNTLERDPFNVSPDWSQEVAEMFVADARFVGLVRDVGGSLYVIPESDGSTPGDGSDVQVIESADHSAPPKAMHRSRHQKSPKRPRACQPHPFRPRSPGAVVSSSRTARTTRSPNS